MASRPPEFLMQNGYLLRFWVGELGGSQLLVDGRPHGVSRDLFATLMDRDSSGPHNALWLEADEESPLKWMTLLSSSTTYMAASLCTGHLINDVTDPSSPSGHRQPNVDFQVAVVPRRDMGDHLRPYLPCMNLSLRFAGVALCIPVVVAHDDLVVLPGEPPKELLVSYGTDPRHLGYPS